MSGSEGNLMGETGVASLPASAVDGVDLELLAAEQRDVGAELDEDYD